MFPLDLVIPSPTSSHATAQPQTRFPDASIPWGVVNLRIKPLAVGLEMLHIDLYSPARALAGINSGPRILPRAVIHFGAGGPRGQGADDNGQSKRRWHRRL